MISITTIRHWLANKIAPPGQFIPDTCEVCAGTGEVYTKEGWYAPCWIKCANCAGTGELPEALRCGCFSLRGEITKCLPGHGHTLGGSKFIDKVTTLR